MTTKLQAFNEVNKKIDEIQRMYRIQNLMDDGVSEILFQVPDDERLWSINPDLSDDAKFQKIKFQNYDEDIIDLILVYGKANSKIKKHQRKEPHIFVCIEGKMIVTVNDIDFTLKRGESMFIKPNDWHEIKFINTTKLIIIYL